MKKRSITLLLVLVMVCSTLTACNGGQPGGAPSGTTPATGTPVSPGASDPAESQAPLKDSLVLGVGSEYSQIVPLSSNTPVANRDGLVIFSLYDPLVWRDPWTGEIQPCLAESWDISADATEYILRIRQDVTFHNGEKLTAEDVVWTLNLLPECPAVSTQNVPTWSHAELVDEFTVKIVLTAPFAAMLNALASYHIVALSKDYYDEVGWEGYQAHPIGTGPYSFVERILGSSLSFKAYDGYWGAKANITDLKVSIISDPNSQMIALETGEIDAMYNASISNATRLDTSRGLKVDIGPSYLTCAMSMALGLPDAPGPLYDVNLRKAVLAAINYDGINNAINQGYTQKAENYVAPGTYCRPEDGTYTASITYDKEAAKSYLAASNYKGEVLRMACIAGSKEEQILTIVLGNLQEIGINAELNAVDGSTFMTLMYTPGSFEIVVNNSMPSLFDANLIYQMFDRRMASWPMNINPFKEELADLAAATVSEMDEAKRTELFRQISDVINREALNGFLYYDASTMAYNENLSLRLAPSSNFRIAEWHW